MLRKAGLNVVRMNFSHGAYEYHQSVIDNSREAERTQPGRPLAIALDTVSRVLHCSIGQENSNSSNRKDPRFALAIPKAMRIYQSVKGLR